MKRDAHAAEYDSDEDDFFDGDYTAAEFEEEKQRRATRIEHDRELRDNPQAAFREMFPTFWTPYANFPLPLLAFIPFEPVPFAPFKEDQQREKRARFRERLCDFIHDYTLVRVTDEIYWQQKVDVMKLPQPSKPPVGYDASQRLDHAVGAAMLVMKRKHADMDSLTDVCLDSREFIKKHGIDPDHTARVQISLALLGAEHPDLTERDLRVLMAVNSSCGSKGWNQTSQEVIGMRAVGAMSEAMLRTLRVQPMTRRQVQLAFEKLRDKGLIHYTAWRKKTTYIGNASLLDANTWMSIVATEINRRMSQPRAHTSGRNAIKLIEQNGKLVFTDKQGKKLASYDKVPVDGEREIWVVGGDVRPR